MAYYDYRIILDKFEYNDIKIGFINDDITLLKKRDKDINNKDIINRLFDFKHKFFILHDNISLKTKCLVCGDEIEAFNNIYYDTNTRYIIPEYYFHYITKHDNIIDDALLELSDKSIRSYYNKETLYNY